MPPAVGHGGRKETLEDELLKQDIRRSLWQREEISPLLTLAMRILC